MGEIVELTARIEEMLANSADDSISKAVFEAQSLSFVVGNAFDVYADGDTISNAKVATFEKFRLNTKL
jgi:hypothetical protein